MWARTGLWEPRGGNDLVFTHVQTLSRGYLKSFEYQLELVVTTPKGLPSGFTIMCAAEEAAELSNLPEKLVDGNL